MINKTILLVDDEQSFLAPLADALEHEGASVLKASTVADALAILQKSPIDLITIDIMLEPGVGLAGKLESHRAGVYLCEQVREKYPHIEAFSISVMSDRAVIGHIESLGVRFLRKGETPLRTVLNMIRSRLTGTAYSSEHRKPRNRY